MRTELQGARPAPTGSAFAQDTTPTAAGVDGSSASSFPAVGSSFDSGDDTGDNRPPGSTLRDFAEANPSSPIDTNSLDLENQESDDGDVDGQDPDEEISKEELQKKLSDEENKKLEELLANQDESDESKQELIDYLKELSDKYGIPLEDLLRILGLSEDDFADELANAGQGGGSGGESGGGSGGGGSGGGGSGGGGSGGGGSGGGGSGGGSNGSDSTKPESPQQASSVNGKVKFYAENKADAEKMKKTFDELYSTDKDFKQNIDKLIDQYGDVNISAKDLSPGTAGFGDVNGNNFALDMDYLTDKKVMAHEMLHNRGWNHGPAMDAEVQKNSDGR